MGRRARKECEKKKQAPNFVEKKVRLKIVKKTKGRID